MYAINLTTFVGTTAVPADTGTAFTNLGTTAKYFGTDHTIKFDGYTTIRIIVRSANGAGQSGTTTVAVRNITDASNTATLAWTDATMTNREAATTISLSGLKKIMMTIVSSNTTDDPLMVNAAIQLER